MNFTQIESLFHEYDFSFDGPMKNGMQSIPLGNGEMGANVWAEKDGVLKILLSRTDAWSESCRLLKTGLFQLELNPNPFREKMHFHFSIADAVLLITAPGVQIRIYVDANAPCLRLKISSDKEISAALRNSNYRAKSYDWTSDFSNYHMQDSPVSFPESADVVLDEEEMIGQYHYNQTSCYQYSMELQSLAEFAQGTKDPLLHRIFGCAAWGNMKKCGALLVAEGEKEIAVSISTATEASSSPEEWLRNMKARKETHGIGDEVSYAAHKAYWNEQWEKCYVLCPQESKGYSLAKGFLYQRYMNLCAGKGPYPIKFNGSIFTADEMEGHPGNYDARRWGGPYWIQNTRLVYWAMLESGDYELIKPFLRMCMDVVPVSKERVRRYFGHRGMLIPETFTFFGTYANSNYGYFHDNGVRGAYGAECHMPGELPNRYIRWHYSGMVEIAWLMFRYVEKSGDTEFLPNALEFTKQVLLFFRDHFEIYDGKLFMTPVSSMETWQYCVNDTPDIAGLMVLIDAVRSAGKADENLLALCEEMEKLLPDIPMDQIDGKKVIAACERKVDIVMRNVENPELYTVFPFYLYGLGKPDLDVAVNTYHARLNRLGKGWSQDALQAALLGLTEEAAEQMLNQVPMVDERCIFPSFWGPNFDDTPDQDHGNNILMCVAAMLRQEEKVFPAWPKEWDVQFRLPKGRERYMEVGKKNGEVIIYEM